MKKEILLLSVLIICLYSNLKVWSAEPPRPQSPVNAPLQTLSLKDGSVIRGQLIAVEGDSYIIKSENMGTVKVRMADLENLSTGNTTRPAAGTSSTNTTPFVLPANGTVPSEQIAQMQNQLLADPQIMSLVQEFISDPEVKAALTEQNLMADLMSMDPQKIQANPRMQKLLSHPKMQQILKLIQDKNQTP